jgi:hypothetical protein
MKKLSSYLSAGIAATATFQSTDAATIVTTFGPGARSQSTTPATPAGIDFGLSNKTSFAVDRGKTLDTVFGYTTPLSIFTSGDNLKATAGNLVGTYFTGKSFSYGAQSGSANYANISFNGNDGVYEAVGQFNFDGAGGGYLIAIAKNDDNTALSISQGKAAIDAVPEPSAIALLALGAGGMAMRRRRKVA